MPAGLAAGLGLLLPPGDTGDLAYFVHAGERLLSGSWSQVYSDPSLQVGPLQLVLFGLLSDPRAIGAVVGALTALLFWVVARRLLNGRGGSWAVLTATLVPVALGLTFDAYRDGHPAQVLVPLLWVLAGLELRAGRAWLAGALVGLSAGFEVWGLLGVAVFAIGPRASAFRAAAIATTVAALPLLPFVVAGHFAMFDYHWQVNGDTLLSLIVEPGTTFTWPLRVIQGLAAVSAGVMVIRSVGRSASALWAGPLAVVCVRLALDPVRYPWYWLALETLVLVGGVQLATLLPASILQRTRAWRNWQTRRV